MATKSMRLKISPKEEVPVKKKKKKKRTELVEQLGSVLSGRLSKTDVGSMRSIVGDNSEHVLQLLESGNDSTAIPIIYKILLQSVIDLLPYAEDAIRTSKGSKGVYQYNSLISSMRELMVDVQSSQDRGQLGAVIVDTILRPSYKDLAVSVMTEYKAISDDVNSVIDRLIVTARVPSDTAEKERIALRKIMTESRGRLAAQMQSQYQASSEKIVDYLQR
jgi:hypothetical protein